MKLLTQKLTILFIALLTFTACSNDDRPDVPAPPAERTILCYLVSNDSYGTMDNALKYNIIGIYRALTKTDKATQVLVYFRPKADDSNITAPLLIEFTSNGYGKVNGKEALADAVTALTQHEGQYNAVKVNTALTAVLSQAVVRKTYSATSNAMNPTMMHTVFSDMLTYSSSGKHVMIMGTHATGWLQDNRVFSSRSFGNDDGYSIYLPEFRQVLARSFSTANLECLFLDACMMGTAEVAYELKDIANYFLFSLMETPLLGYPYETILPTLLEKNINYQSICDAFKTFYTGYTDWGTSSVVKASTMDNFASVVKTELARFSAQIPTLNTYAIQQYGVDHGRSTTQWDYFSFDVGDTFRVLNGGTIPASIQTALSNTVVAKSVLTGYNFGGLVVNENKYSGIGMYLPVVPRASWNTYYKKLAWYTAVDWATVYP